MMSQNIISLSFYIHLVHVTQDDMGKDVDWVGFFSGLDKGIAEGCAYEAVLDDLLHPVLIAVNKGYTVRQYANDMKYKLLDYFSWKRLSDSSEIWVRNRCKVVTPCIPFGSVTSEHLFDDPEFKTIQRHIVTLYPTLQNGKPIISLDYSPE